VKVGDLVVLDNIRDYKRWEFWPLNEDEVKRLLTTGKTTYNTSKNVFAAELNGLLCEIVWISLLNSTTCHIYVPTFDMYTHIFLDCLKPLNGSP
jgi:hypothetical protein